ncbi:hypothetical protein Tco_0126571 [Tanacetum coccineum]
MRGGGLVSWGWHRDLARNLRGMGQLVNDIVSLKQQNCSIKVYYHKLKGLWDEHDALEAPYLCNCACSCENGKNNGDREQRKRLIQFLMGLDECYSNLRGQILLLQPLPLVAKAYGMVRQEEKQREGHSADECYNLKGYPIGHPLHGKYKPPVTRSVNVNDNRNPKVNFVRHDAASTSTQAEASTSGIDAVFVRIYQLQNQLNQVMLMMQQCQKDPPSGKINSYTIRRHKFIASVMSRFKTAWVTDSGATDHICIILSIMHDTFICNPPIHVTLPNGQTVEVKICGKVKINADITLVSTRGLLMATSMKDSTSFTLIKSHLHLTLLSQQTAKTVPCYGIQDLDTLPLPLFSKSNLFLFLVMTFQNVTFVL